MSNTGSQPDGRDRGGSGSLFVPAPDLAPQEYLLSLERHGIKLGLETIGYLLDHADRPHQGYPTTHVAGTNGKGSTVAMLCAILRAAGYTVGRFTSPHLIHLNERFQIDSIPISDDALDEQIVFFRRIAEAREWLPPTFFEMNAAIAFRWFAQRRVDAAIIEVGMGGRFDATNVLNPEVAVITNIELDHMRFLGDTLEAIAFEKAGILKEGRPAVVSEMKPGPCQVILDRAQELDCPVSLLGRDFTCHVEGTPLDVRFFFKSPELDIGPVPLGLAGRFQGPNAAVSTMTAWLLRQRFPNIDRGAIERGLRGVRWPCRLERVLDDPPVIIDVAHNVAGAVTLAPELPPGCILVFAVSKDKDASAMLDALAPLAHTLILTQFSGDRALPVGQLCAVANQYSHYSTPDLAEAIATGLDLASAEHPLVITGSIFTCGEARQILIERHGAPAPAF
ncbi:MAG TPA: folylpolyglutamate synthase/dihydrofolate synthase family protein [Candidatus Hydrogenedentes bacterium]|nr:folylpolyglutamate synthase/dihydrofolate synthase family protein [Candidatus Hydrogenedentota bacterium]HPG68552.1 folylpolyglutamate synthase/dihydrofolate synthase family protein [Candidatus Hydrogenedentota bacterium]